MNQDAQAAAQRLAGVPQVDLEYLLQQALPRQIAWEQGLLHIAFAKRHTPQIGQPAGWLSIARTRLRMLRSRRKELVYLQTEYERRKGVSDAGEHRG